MKVKQSYQADEFQRLISRETDTLELKAGLGQDPLQDALVAFSNGSGGVILSVSETTGPWSGANVSRALMIGFTRQPSAPGMSVGIGSEK